MWHKRRGEVLSVFCLVLSCCCCGGEKRSDVCPLHVCVTWMRLAAGCLLFSKCFCRCCSCTFRAKPDPRIPCRKKKPRRPHNISVNELLRNSSDPLRCCHDLQLAGRRRRSPGVQSRLIATAPSTSAGSCHHTRWLSGWSERTFSGEQSDLLVIFGLAARKEGSFLLFTYGTCNSLHCLRGFMILVTIHHHLLTIKHFTKSEISLYLFLNWNLLKWSYLKNKYWDKSGYLHVCLTVISYSLHHVYNMF